MPLLMTLFLPRLLYNSQLLPLSPVQNTYSMLTCTILLALGSVVSALPAADLHRRQDASSAAQVGTSIPPVPLPSPITVETSIPPVSLPSPISSSTRQAASATQSGATAAIASMTPITELPGYYPGYPCPDGYLLSYAEDQRTFPYGPEVFQELGIWGVSQKNSHGCSTDLHLSKGLAQSAVSLILQSKAPAYLFAVNMETCKSTLLKRASMALAVCAACMYLACSQLLCLCAAYRPGFSAITETLINSTNSDTFYQAGESMS